MTEPPFVPGYSILGIVDAIGEGGTNFTVGDSVAALTNIDFIFNGMGDEYIERGLAVLRRGGVLVHYGGPQRFSRFLLLLAKLVLFNLLPNGKPIKGYGTHRLESGQVIGNLVLVSPELL